jgi:hypothetical protein
MPCCRSASAGDGRANAVPAAFRQSLRSPPLSSSALPPSHPAPHRAARDRGQPAIRTAQTGPQAHAGLACPTPPPRYPLRATGRRPSRPLDAGRRPHRRVLHFVRRSQAAATVAPDHQHAMAQTRPAQSAGETVVHRVGDGHDRSQRGCPTESQQRVECLSRYLTDPPACAATYLLRRSLGK